MGCYGGLSQVWIFSYGTWEGKRNCDHYGSLIPGAQTVLSSWLILATRNGSRRQKWSWPEQPGARITLVSPFWSWPTSRICQVTQYSCMYACAKLAFRLNYKRNHGLFCKLNCSRWRRVLKTRSPAYPICRLLQGYTGKRKRFRASFVYFSICLTITGDIIGMENERNLIETRSRRLIISETLLNCLRERSIKHLFVSIL